MTLKLAVFLAASLARLTCQPMPFLYYYYFFNYYPFLSSTCLLCRKILWSFSHRIIDRLDHLPSLSAALLKRKYDLSTVDVLFFFYLLTSTSKVSCLWDNAVLKDVIVSSPFYLFPCTYGWLQCHNIKNKNRNHSTNEVKKLGYERWLRSTSFPGSCLFLPRESTLVAAGHVSARFLQIPDMWLKGGARKLKFVSAQSLPTEPSREWNL